MLCGTAVGERCTLVYLLIVILGLISIAFMILRRFVRKRTFGRFAATFFTAVFWVAFLALLGYQIGYTAGDKGVSALKILHISRNNP
ncbi:hypothetical protein [Alicyclobacillus suci]|uniref:hypothetical protein n=1 Tax=Alicyclobacillus suci TaxID=2816080 RepID=UPI001A8C8702|nr:hypothetical protein [Alicyclobacillus suci]